MRSLLFLILLSCSACGYHATGHFQEANGKTLSIPYAYGDGDGLLTAEIIAQVQKETGFNFSQNGGEYTLKVHLLDTKNQNIGFRYDPHKLESGKKKLIPEEVRRRLLANVSIIHSASNAVVKGPAYIMGTCEYDHRYYNLSHNINRFSLGQLTDIDTTYDVVNTPLYRDLARQIALWLANNSDSLEAPHATDSR
jgi:hypothetical protein